MFIQRVPIPLPYQIQDLLRKQEHCLCPVSPGYCPCMGWQGCCCAGTQGMGVFLFVILSQTSWRLILYAWRPFNGDSMPISTTAQEMEGAHVWNWMACGSRCNLKTKQGKSSLLYVLGPSSQLDNSSLCSWDSSLNLGLPMHLSGTLELRVHIRAKTESKLKFADFPWGCTLTAM